MSTLSPTREPSRTSNRPRLGLEVAENIWLAAAPGVVVWESAPEYLARGIRRVASRMDEYVSGPGSGAARAV